MYHVQGHSRKHLFLSYSWQDSELANTIDAELSNSGFEVMRDIRDIGYWKSIKDFMALISSQDYAIIIISPNYLKSPNCMYEVMELLKSPQHRDKVLSIVTPDADIYNPLSRINYIKYWEEKTETLEQAIRPLKMENTAELTSELRKYKSIETTIAQFLDLISDKNNPNIIDAIESVKKILATHTNSLPNEKLEDAADNVRIKVEACHYAFLKFAALRDVTGTQLEEMIGIKKLSDDNTQDLYDLPMLQCEVINCSNRIIVVQEPIIEGVIELENEMTVNALSFLIKSSEEKRLEANAKIVFDLHGPIVISVIKALFEDRIEKIYVKDNFGFCYNAVPEEIEAMKQYFLKYCSDLADLKNRHAKYCL